MITRHTKHKRTHTELNLKPQKFIIEPNHKFTTGHSIPRNGRVMTSVYVYNMKL